MRTRGWHRTTRTLAVSAATVLLAACAAESTLAPHATADEAAATFAVSLGGAGRQVDLGDCTHLRAPEGSIVAAHLYARGVQLYRWNGAAWVFEGPLADLYADAGFTGQVGTHSAGPIWVHNGGGTVRGSAPVACPVAGDAIPWLLLRAAPDEMAGPFNRVTAIQRVNTTGGRMPAAPGTTPGEVREVPYTAEYYFYR